MHAVTQSLIKLLTVKSTHKDEQGCQHYQGDCEDLGFRNLFGGQILGQSLYSAIKTAPEGFLPHSLHAYFLLPGHVNAPVDYKVEELRLGRSFATYRVDAIQDGKIIFTQDCSFQRPEKGYEHQDPMPTPKGPDGIISHLELSRMVQDVFPDHLRDKYTAEKPLEMRTVEPVNMFMPVEIDPIKHVWIKPIDDWSDQDIALQYALLAYNSDFNLLTTAMQPHGVSVASKGIQVASLDHAMWFHHKPRTDDWWLYKLTSPAAAGGRGLNFGHIYHKDGQLMVTTAQEGLMRMRSKS